MWVWFGWAVAAAHFDVLVHYKVLDGAEKNVVVVVNTDDFDVGCGDVDFHLVAPPPRAGIQRVPDYEGKKRDDQWDSNHQTW